MAKKSVQDISTYGPKNPWRGLTRNPIASTIGIVRGAIQKSTGTATAIEVEARTLNFLKNSVGMFYGPEELQPWTLEQFRDKFHEAVGDLPRGPQFLGGTRSLTQHIKLSFDALGKALDNMPQPEDPRYQKHLEHIQRIGKMLIPAVVLHASILCHDPLPTDTSAEREFITQARELSKTVFRSLVNNPELAEGIAGEAYRNKGIMTGHQFHVASILSYDENVAAISHAATKASDEDFIYRLTHSSRTAEQKVRGDSLSERMARVSRSLGGDPVAAKESASQHFNAVTGTGDQALEGGSSAGDLVAQQLGGVLTGLDYEVDPSEKGLPSNIRTGASHRARTIVAEPPSIDGP